MKLGHYTALIALCAMPLFLFGQQEPMYTRYMFNKILFNPACAGSDNHLSVNLTHRRQWAGIEGAPITQAITVHTPMRQPKVGLGLSIVKDKIGPTEMYDVNVAYAYRMNVGVNMKLSIGLATGFTNWHADWFNIELENNTDEIFQHNITRWFPNFGAGVYLSNDRFYAGIGCPRLLEHDLRKTTKGQVPVSGSLYRNLYATTGIVYPLGTGRVVFRPSMLVKALSPGSRYYSEPRQLKIGTPAEFDLDASFFIQETVWLGLAYRAAVSKQYASSESIDFSATWYLRNGIRVGGSYDLLLSKLRKFSGGSFELMAGYEFDIKVRRVASPRYF
jgi:type IX secretion system PorP/SprF family membrane protein